MNWIENLHENSDKGSVAIIFSLMSVFFLFGHIARFQHCFVARKKCIEWKHEAIGTENILANSVLKLNRFIIYLTQNSTKSDRTEWYVTKPIIWSNNSSDGHWTMQLNNSRYRSIFFSLPYDDWKDIKDTFVCCIMAIKNKIENVGNDKCTQCTYVVHMRENERQKWNDLASQLMFDKIDHVKHSYSEIANKIIWNIYKDSVRL